MRDSNRDFFGAVAWFTFGSIELPGRFTSVISLSKDDIFEFQKNKNQYLKERKKRKAFWKKEMHTTHIV